MIEIKLLNKAQLENFILSKEYSNLENLPISKHRAFSHIENPRAEKDDVLLLLAYFEEEMVGYLGVLPDNIFLENKMQKCAWLSCLWVNPKQRGKQIGFKLVQKAIDVWNRKIIITEFTDSAKRLYDKTDNFEKLETKEGIRLYIQSDLQKILPPKKEIFRKTIPLLKFIDFAINTFIKIPLFFNKQDIDNFSLENITEIDKELTEFIEENQEKEIFKRQEKEINWIIKNPWILSAPKVDEFNKRYYFSSIEKSFEFIPLKVKDKDNKLIAFILFTKRNDFLKMPYCYYKKGAEVDIVKIINHHIINLKIKTFTCYNINISEYLLKNKTLSIYKKQTVRKYLISKSFNFKETNFNIQDGDGDCAFT